MKINKKDFSSIHILLVLLVIGIVGFIGWYVWDKNKTENSNQDQTITISNTPAAAKSDTEMAELLVSQAYNKAAAYSLRTTNADQGQIDSAKDELSAELYAKMSADYANNSTDRDPFTCAQSTVPSYLISSIDPEDGTIIVTVKEDFNTPYLVSYTVDTNSQKIINITCQD